MSASPPLACPKTQCMKLETAEEIRVDHTNLDIGW